MAFVSIRVALVLSLGCLTAARAETPLGEARSTLEKWVEARQLVSKTRSDWQADKELLEQSVQLFDRELKSVEAQGAKLGTNSVQVDKERAQAEALLAASKECLDQAGKFAAEFEGKLVRLVPRLPTPLQEILKPLLARIPADALSTKMAATERIQVVVAVLNELDKFNNAVTIFGEKRKNAKGEEVAAETVYVGLGAAYFVNDAGDFAGSGSPGPKGWEWSIQPELAGPIREVVRIYRNEQSAKFVGLPVTVK